MGATLLNRFRRGGAARALGRLAASAIVLAASASRAAGGSKPMPKAPAARVDTATLTGKVMCGYQGWFTAEGDGAGRGWFHYSSRGGFKPGRCSIDFWPDVSELDDDEKYATPFRHRDGRVAHVFSSVNRKTVLRHFRWMRDYGIDGVFVQRFAGQTFGAVSRRHCDTVLKHCRDGANQHGRAYAVMYDLSGLRAGQMGRVIDDFKRLVDKIGITRTKSDRAYLHHAGRPVVAVWGVGFNDGRKYTLDECGKLVDFLAKDSRYGPCTVMLGVPTGWRTFDRDSVRDRALHEVILKAHIVSPWTIGRYHTLALAARHRRERLEPDIAWCKAHGKDYLPVVFPGFSWHNMRPRARLGQIPRLGGRFLWKQFVEARRAGATMVYQAMFDEMDEGTAIFKCTNDPPVGDSRFLTYENLPTDHYLWLVGMGGRLIRGEIDPTEDLPARRPTGRAGGGKAATP